MSAAAAARVKSCVVCGSTVRVIDPSSSSNSTRLLKCTRCMAARYCSKAHQVQHWPSHKTTCAAPSGAAPGEGAAGTARAPPAPEAAPALAPAPIPRAAAPAAEDEEMVDDGDGGGGEGEEEEGDDNEPAREEGDSDIESDGMDFCFYPGGMNERYLKLKRELEANDPAATAAWWHGSGLLAHHGGMSRPIATEASPALLDMSAHPHQVMPPPLRDAGTRTLCIALSNNSHVKVLDLSGNYLSVYAASYLTQLLMRNRTGLTEIHLAANCIGDRGATQLASAFNALPSSRLQVLSLKGNLVKDAGCCALADALHGNRFLTTLDLSGNYIGDAGFQRMGLMLTANKYIRRLDLSANKRVTNAGIAQLRAGAARNTSVALELPVNGCPGVTADAVSAFDQFMAARLARRGLR